MNKYKKFIYLNGVTYFIKKTEKENFYHIFHIESKEKNEFKLFEGLIPLRPNIKDLNLEKSIFPKGRSKSIYENLITIYLYIIENNISNFKIKINFTNYAEIHNYLLTEYKINLYLINSEYKIASYGKKVLDDLEHGKSKIIDKDYDNRCYGITQYSVKFFEELSKIINVTEIENVSWQEIKNDLIVELRWRDRTIILTGLGAGYGGEGPRGFAKVLSIAGFGNELEKVFNQKEGRLSKNKRS